MAVENRQIEYRVRTVTRYVVTRYESGEYANGVETKGEFDNDEIAHEVARALCKDEHQRLGWPIDDERIKYPESPEVAAAKAAMFCNMPAQGRV